MELFKVLKNFLMVFYIYDRFGKFWYYGLVIFLLIIYIRLFVIKYIIMRYIYVFYNFVKIFEMFYIFEDVYDRSGIVDFNLRKEYDFNYN